MTSSLKIIAAFFCWGGGMLFEILVHFHEIYVAKIMNELIYYGFEAKCSLIFDNIFLLQKFCAFIIFKKVITD